VADPTKSATSTIQVHRPDAGELDTSFGDGGYYFGEVGTAAGEAWVNPSGDDIYLPETLTVADGGTYMRLRHLLANGVDDPNYQVSIGAPGTKAFTVLPGGRWLFGAQANDTVIEPRTPAGLFLGRHGEPGYQITNTGGGGSCVYEYDDLGTTHLRVSGFGTAIVDGGQGSCGAILDYSSPDSTDSFTFSTATCIDAVSSYVEACVQTSRGIVYGLSARAGSVYDLAVWIDQILYDFAPNRLEPNNVTLSGSDLIYSGSLYALTNAHQACVTTVDLSGSTSALFGGGVCPQLEYVTNVVPTHGNAYFVAGERYMGLGQPLAAIAIKLLPSGDYSSFWVAPITSNSIQFKNVATQSNQRVLLFGTDSQNRQSFAFRIWP
jgi:hypothetical protein